MPENGFSEVELPLLVKQRLGDQLIRPNTVSFGKTKTRQASNTSKRVSRSAGNGYAQRPLPELGGSRPPRSSTPPWRWDFSKESRSIHSRGHSRGSHLSSLDGRMGTDSDQETSDSIYSATMGPQSMQRPSTTPSKNVFEKEMERDYIIRTSAGLTPIRINNLRNESGGSALKLQIDMKKRGKELKELLGIGQQYHAATKIASLARMVIAQNFVYGYNGLRDRIMATRIQALFRGFAIRYRKEIDLKNLRHFSALRIQRMVRVYFAQKTVRILLGARRTHSIIQMQRVVRGGLARKRVRLKVFEIRRAAATIIQSLFRKYAALGFRGPIARRRQERAVQRRSMKLFLSGATMKLLQKKPDDNLLAVRVALGLHVIHRNTQEALSILDNIDDLVALRDISRAILCLANNKHISRQLSLLIQARRLVNQDDTGDIVKDIGLMIRDVFAACIMQRPQDHHAVFNLAVALLVIHYGMGTGFGDDISGRKFTQNRISKLLYRAHTLAPDTSSKHNIFVIQQLFKTWFIAENDDSVLLTHSIQQLNAFTDISVRRRGSAWLIFSAQEACCPPLVVHTSKKMGIPQIEKICDSLRLFKTSQGFIVAIPSIEQRLQVEFHKARMNKAAARIQRTFLKFAKRLKSRVSGAKDGVLRKQALQFQTQLDARDRIRNNRQRLISTVKAHYIGNRTRNRLQFLHTKAIECQRIIRGKFGRNRAAERKDFLEYGARVIKMFGRGRCVSGLYLYVEVYRSGYNWLIRGFSHEKATAYQGLLRREHVTELVKKHPYGLDSVYSAQKKERLRIWHHERVCDLLVLCLAVTDPIHGLGELFEYDGKKIMICDVTHKSKARGPSVLDRSGLGRVLPDTKDFVWPRPGTKYYEKRQRQKRQRAKTAPVNYNPRTREILPRLSTAK
jgi:hypothetical protein